MASKIFRKGNYIYVSDTVTGVVNVDSTRNVIVYPSTATAYVVKSPNFGTKVLEFADIKTEAGAAYASQATWDTFWQSNTGGTPPTV